MNRVLLVGRIGHDPELKMSKNGRPYTRLSLATNRTFTQEDDKVTETADWHSVFVFGTLAETCCQFLSKGALVYVDGSLSYWKVAEENSDAKKYMNAIHARSVDFLSLAKSRENQTASENLDNRAEPRNHNAVAHPA